jgi:hypothetical protein
MQSRYFSVFVDTAFSNAAKRVVASEEGDDGENATVQEDLAEPEVDPIVEDEGFVRPEAGNEGKDAG